MKTLTFTFGRIIVHCVIPSDICTVFSDGRVIWAGTHNELIKILEQL